MSAEIYLPNGRHGKNGGWKRRHVSWYSPPNSKAANCRADRPGDRTVGRGNHHLRVPHELLRLQQSIGGRQVRYCPVTFRTANRAPKSGELVANSTHEIQSSKVTSLFRPRKIMARHQRRAWTLISGSHWRLGLPRNSAITPTLYQREKRKYVFSTRLELDLLPQNQGPRYTVPFHLVSFGVEAKSSLRRVRLNTPRGVGKPFGSRHVDGRAKRSLRCLHGSEQRCFSSSNRTPQWLIEDGTSAISTTSTAMHKNRYAAIVQYTRREVIPNHSDKNR